MIMDERPNDHNQPDAIPHDLAPGAFGTLFDPNLAM